SRGLGATSIALRPGPVATPIRSEQHLEPELPEAREVGLTDLVLVNRTEISVGRVLEEGAFVVLRRVEDVGSFAGELESHPLRDAEGLGEVHVELLEAGPANLVRSNWRRTRLEWLADDERWRGAAGRYREVQQLAALRHAWPDALNQFDAVAEPLAL